MIVKRDYRNRGPGEVNISMSVAEFREHVEWCELLDPRDGATKDLRAWLDDICPPDPVFP